MAMSPSRAHAFVLAGLMMGILLAALDQTIVATSLFKIVGDLGGFEHFSWLFAAYMLGSTIVIPIAGKMSDIYGRRPVYIAGMGVFLLGSMLCGTATDMTQLIIFRGVQGLGGGAIFPVALATIADLYAPGERGRVMGLFGAVFGLSSVIGPFLGGWIVDYVHVFGIASWRWVFYVNAPVGVAAIAMVSIFFPRNTARRKASIDYAGIATLTTTLVALLLITVLGGDTYAWASPQIFGLVALSLLGLGLFVLAERRAADPLMPLELFRNPVFAVSATASLLGGAAMFTVITFMPTYLQGVVGISATYSGSVLVPLSIGLVGGSVLSGALIKRFGYKPFALLGFAISIVGYLLLSRLGAHPPIWLAVAEMAFLGVGIGFTIQTFILATQNAVERRHTGAATSSITLFRTLGATLGVSALGVVLNRRLQTEIPGRVEGAWVERFLANPATAGKIENIPPVLIQPDAVASISAAPGGAEALEGLRLAFTSALHSVFIIAAGVALVGLFVVVFLRSVPMKSAEEYHRVAEPDALVAP